MSELQHYGVKGMKWGVRRSDPPGDSRDNPDPSASRTSADSKAAAAATGKANSAGGIHVLSNHELQQAITRMNLERNYHNLTSPPEKGQLDKGLSQAQRILSIGTTLENARKFLETPTGKAVKTGVTSAFAAGAAYATGGASAAAGAGASVVIRKAANHYTNVGN